MHVAESQVVKSLGPVPFDPEATVSQLAPVDVVQGTPKHPLGCSVLESREGFRQGTAVKSHQTASSGGGTLISGGGPGQQLPPPEPIVPTNNAMKTACRTNRLHITVCRVSMSPSRGSVPVAVTSA